MPHFYHGDVPFEIVFDYKSEWDNNADLRGVFDDNECAQARTENKEEKRRNLVALRERDPQQ